jgi:2'-5' RNA ligase
MDPMAPPGAHGLLMSLWLVPDGEVGRQLAGWIDRLAERFRSERFAPHVTLLSGLSLEPAQAEAAVAHVAAELSPFTVRLDGVDGREEHFRCLYALAVADEPLRAAHAAASRAFGREPQADFLPHLSLVYGRLLPEQKHAVAHEAGPEVSLRFLAGQLHLWSTQGAVCEWREQAVVPLGRPSPAAGG